MGLKRSKFPDRNHSHQSNVLLCQIIYYLASSTVLRTEDHLSNVSTIHISSGECVVRYHRNGVYGPFLFLVLRVQDQVSTCPSASNFVTNNKSCLWPALSGKTYTICQREHECGITNALINAALWFTTDDFL